MSVLNPIIDHHYLRSLSRLEYHLYIRLLKHKQASYTSQPLCQTSSIRLYPATRSGYLSCPGDLQEPLKCNLQSVQLSSLLEYEALSYCWEHPSLTHTVACNGSEVRVTQSLHSAWHRLRYKDRSRILWADAICINQKEHEKIYQLRLMNTIYSRAAQVSIWLGEDDDWSKTLGEFIPQVCEARTKYQATVNARPVMELSATELEKLGLPRRYDLRYLALSALVNRPWFDRTWIIQEVAKSSIAVVYCGDWTVPWRDFALRASQRF
jgi:hypothetical protein